MNNTEKNEMEQYWTKRYVDHSTGWDLGDISAPIQNYVDQLTNKDIHILIPGAGNAYEAEYLFRIGFKNIYILDISALPLENFKKRVPNFPVEQIITGDFFELKMVEKFDLILEQTFFCSFPPIDNIREKYVHQMYQFLKPNGKLVGVWFNIPFSGDYTKRPFGATKLEYIQFFQNYFTMKVLEEAHNSVLDRSGKELFGILEKKVVKD